MRILHVVHSFQTGGAETVILNLIKFGDPAISNVVCSLTEPNELARQLDPDRASFVCLKKRPGNDLKVILRLARLIDEEQIDLVHTQGWGTYLESLSAAKLCSHRRPPVVFAFHGKSITDATEGVPWRRLVAQRLAFPFTDRCIAPAAHMACDYAGAIHVNARRIEVIYNGIDTDAFVPRTIETARARLGIARGDFVVGFVGRLDPVKDLEGAIEAFAQFRSALDAPRRSSVRMILVGEGRSRGALERMIGDFDLREAVTFAGLQSDVIPWIAAMDVYFQPSLYEGHSLSLLEAMAMSRPVVSTRVGGTPEIFADNASGILVAARDYAAMAEALRRLYDDAALRASMGAAARQRVSTEFDVRMMAARYESLYQRLLPRSSAPCVA